MDLTKVVGVHFNSILKLISSRSALIGRTSLIAMLKATYSAAVELRVWSLCNLLDHRMGHPNKVKVNPVLENLTQTGS